MRFNTLNGCNKKNSSLAKLRSGKVNRERDG